MKKCCLNCHFLAKSRTNVAGQRERAFWNERELSQLHADHHFAEQCAQGVWNTGLEPKLKARLPEILQRNRGNSCYFFKRQPGMSFPAAEKLQAHEATNRADRKATIAIWISIATFLTGVVFALINLLREACLLTF